MWLMSNEPDPLMREEDAELLRSLVSASEKNTAVQERVLLATMSANILSGMEKNNANSVNVAYRAKRAVDLAREVLAEIDRAKP